MEEEQENKDVRRGREPHLRRIWLRDLAVSVLFAVSSLFSSTAGEGRGNQHDALAHRSGTDLHQQVYLSFGSAVSSAAIWWCSGFRWTKPNRISSASSGCRATRWRSIMRGDRERQAPQRRVRPGRNRDHNTYPPIEVAPNHYYVLAITAVRRTTAAPGHCRTQLHLWQSSICLLALRQDGAGEVIQRRPNSHITSDSATLSRMQVAIGK